MKLKDMFFGRKNEKDNDDGNHTFEIKVISAENGSIKTSFDYFKDVNMTYATYHYSSQKINKISSNLPDLRIVEIKDCGKDVPFGLAAEKRGENSSFGIFRDVHTVTQTITDKLDELKIKDPEFKGRMAYMFETVLAKTKAGKDLEDLAALAGELTDDEVNHLLKDYKEDEKYRCKFGVIAPADHVDMIENQMAERDNELER